MWRWTGFHFGNYNEQETFTIPELVYFHNCFEFILLAIGLDLVMTYEHGSLKLRRNHRTENEMALSQQTRRNLMFRFLLVMLGKKVRLSTI